MSEIVTSIGSGLVLAGALAAIIGSLGVIRFPDFYTRTHAASITDTGAATLMIFGLILISGWSVLALKLAIIWAFIMLTSPTAAHALTNAAYGAGEKPRLGPWRLFDRRSADKAER